MFGLGRCFGLGAGFSGYGTGVYGAAGGVNWIIPLVMGVSRLLILAGIVYLVYRLFSGRRQSCGKNTSSSSAMEILNQRFARGEINEEEYNAKKRQMQN